jgi:hypothetical protein
MFHLLVTAIHPLNHHHWEQSKHPITSPSHLWLIPYIHRGKPFWGKDSFWVDTEGKPPKDLSRDVTQAVLVQLDLGAADVF